MAIALTKVAATPYSLKYSLGGGAGTATRTATQILGDCVAGPLKTLLTEVNSGLTIPGVPSGWTSLTSANQFSLYFMPTSATGNDTAAVSFTSGPNALTGTLQAGNVSGIVELRYHPSSMT